MSAAFPARVVTMQSVRSRPEGDDAFAGDGQSIQVTRNDQGNAVRRIMRHVARRILLTTATLCAAGCAKSDFQIARQNRGNMQPVTDPVIANIPEEKQPQILPETHFAAGILFESQGQFDRAILQYRKAVALNANYVAAFHRLGLLQSAIGQHLEAAQTLQCAVALRPDNAILRNNLGFERMLAQQWDEAENELRRAIELQPDLAIAHINLGLVHAKAKRFAESLASFQAVLPDADAYYNLGLMFRGQQRYAEAREAFRHVLTIDPEFSAAKIQLERLASRTVPPTSAEAVAETPRLERVDSPVPIVTGETLLPATAPELLQEQYAVESQRECGTRRADLAATLVVIDADKNCSRPVDRPTVDEEVVAGASDEESIGEVVQDPPTGTAAQVPADDPYAVGMMMPAVVESSKDAFAGFEEFKVEERTAAGLVEKAQAVATTFGIAEPLTLFDPDVEEVDADEVIASLPAAPTIRPTGLTHSWAMLEELEAKVAMLRDETQAIRRKLVSVTWP